MMHVIRLLVFFAARFNFWFTALHIPGKQNILADALSRNNVSFSSAGPTSSSTGGLLVPLVSGPARPYEHNLDIH